MDIKEFINNNDVDMSKNLVDTVMIEAAEKEVSVKFGDELTRYLLQYGYLGFEYVELYGMNSNLILGSNMIKQTLYLHKYYPITMAYIAIENQGEGIYYIVNTNDRVFCYDTELDKLEDTGLSLFEYILKRFESVKTR